MSDYQDSHDSLDSHAILNLLPLALQQQLARIIVLPTIDSTNTYLLDLAAKGTPTGTLCFAETQTAGRGRRGRTWLSPAGSNLYFSLLEKLPEHAMGLSIVVGIAIARVLDRVGVPYVALKWPNDIYCQQKKLGGILVELLQRDKVNYAVIGIGLNLDLPAEVIQQIDQPCIDLKTAMPSNTMSRNLLAANLIAELYSALNQFASGGLPSFMAEWMRLDMLQGKWVTVLQSQQQLQGIAEGLDEQGALQVRVAGQLHKIVGGEVSVRL